MSAITGYLLLGGQLFVAANLQAMTDSLRHRGLDEHATWADDLAGLGHCMLRTGLESSEEHLPLERNGLVITADARIDNRRELMAALGFVAESPDSVPDSELLLGAYQRWGEDCAERVVGEFAFAIWDRRRKSLFCARDALGVRPFYYFFTPGHLFAFGSEIKAIFSLPQVPCRINEERIGDYLALLTADKAATFYQDILRLPPGHTLAVDRTRFRLTRYWAPDASRVLPLRTPQEYAEAYREVFTQAVGSRLNSGFPLGSALSGGLDSSSIVCVARELLRADGSPSLKTFSGVFDEVPDSDERPFINAVVEQGGIEPHFVRADKISPLVDWKQVLWHQEEPTWTPNLFMHWGLYTAARQQGVRVFLDGFLGDNVVGHGWEYLMDLAYSWRLVALLKEIDGVTKRQTGFSRGSMMWRYFVEYSVKQRLSQGLARLGQTRKPSVSEISRLMARFDPDFAKRIRLEDRIAALSPPAAAPPGAAQKRHLRDLTAGEIPLGLEISNKIASAFSIEVRYPFADRRLAEFCLATPSTQRIQDGRSRMIVRRALASYLPTQVCWRSGKGDLSHNIAQRLLDFEEDRLDDIILGNPEKISPFCDIRTLRKSYQRYKMHPNASTIQAVWGAVNLALWLDQVAQVAARPGVEAG